MIRIVVYLLILAAVAFGVAWLADRPGQIALDWQGWHIETSVLVAAHELADRRVRSQLDELRALPELDDDAVERWRQHLIDRGYPLDR